jgi:hypothetical protein
MQESHAAVSLSGHLVAFVAHGDANSTDNVGRIFLCVHDRSARHVRVVYREPAGSKARQDVFLGPVEWSPDAERLCFVRNAPGAGGCDTLWVINADGTGRRKIADNASEPAWSPVPRAAP